MHRYSAFHLLFGVVFLSFIAFLSASNASGSPASSYSPSLRRYPYITDVVGSFGTINWGTDRSETTGAVRYGRAGSESRTAHYVPGTKTAITVNGVLEYQWKAQLTWSPELNIAIDFIWGQALGRKSIYGQ